MSQATTVPRNDLAVFDNAVSRMAGCAYGALATLPLYCVGKLHTSGLRALILEQHEKWHSFLVVARQTLRTGEFSHAPEEPINELLEIADQLRDAYLGLAKSPSLSKERVGSAYKELVDAYGRIPTCVDQIGKSLGARLSFRTDARSPRLVVAERSLKWFGEELGLSDQISRS
jgi:hypothetical protein